MATEKNYSGLKGLRFPGLKHDGYFQGEMVDGVWRRRMTPFKTDPNLLNYLLEQMRKAT